MNLEQSVPSQDFELTPSEMAFISDHMAACAEFLEHLDPLWIGEDGEVGDAMLEHLEIAIPDMPHDLGVKLQRRVNNSIQRGNLAVSALTLGTKGVMEVLLAMIRPILTSNKQTKD